jgi:hypothetical protein
MKPVFNILNSIILEEYQYKTSGWREDKIYKILNNSPDFDKNIFISDLFNNSLNNLDDEDIKQYLSDVIPDASRDEIKILKSIIYSKYPKYKDALDSLLLLK